MKKRAVCIILGVLLTGAMFTGCGKNKATEAASESAQTEKEGVGEDVEKDSETDKKSDKDSADKDTSSDKKTSATGTSVATETGTPEEETDTPDAEKLQFYFQMKMNGPEMPKNSRRSLRMMVIHR